MNWYKMIFYHVFKRYYKDGNYKNDIPWLTATGIVSVSTGFMISSVYIFSYYSFVDKNVPQLDNRFTLLGLIFIVANFIFFTHKKRYMEIFAFFKGSEKDNKLWGIISWGYIILGMVSLPAVALIIRN
jgi:hypothetical protein